MDIEIISVEIKKGIVMITGIDVSDENLRRMERMKDDGMQTEVRVLLDISQLPRRKSSFSLSNGK